MNEPIRFVVGKPGVDPTLPNVTLEIDGVAFQLAYDLPSIVLVEQASGINLLLSAIDNPTWSGVVCLLWAATLKAHPEMTMEKAGKLVDLTSILDVLMAVRVAWQRSKPDAKDGGAGEAEAQTTSPEA